MKFLKQKKSISLRRCGVFMVFTTHFLWEKSGANPEIPRFAWQVRGAPAPVRLDLGSSDATVDVSSDPSGSSGRWQRQVVVGAASFGRSEKLGKMKKIWSRYTNK